MKLFQHPANRHPNLIEVELCVPTGGWVVWVRRSAGADWESFDGTEGELADLLDLARDYVTGG
jgi:hypothetical protein